MPVQGLAGSCWAIAENDSVMAVNITIKRSFMQFLLESLLLLVKKAAEYTSRLIGFAIICM